MSERVTPEELRDTAALFSAHAEDKGRCALCFGRWPCDPHVVATALLAAADRIEALEDQNEALRAWPDHPWPDHEPASVSGALADTGDLPGGLRPSAAIRELTRQRDEARAAYSALAIDRLDALMDTTRTVIADGRQEQTP